MYKRFLLFLFLLTSFLFINHTALRAQTPPFDLTGWGWFGNGGYYGFVSLNCANLYPDCSVSGPHFNYKAEVMADNKVEGYAWMGNTDVTHSLGWLKFNPAAAAPDGSTDGVVYDPSTGKLSGWGRISSTGSWVKFRDDDDDEWGVEVDTDDAGNHFLRGLAWASGDDQFGFGFINFGLETWQAIDGTPWLQTERGDVYTEGDIDAIIDAESEYTEFNATYLILANGSISNFNSEQGDDWEEDSADLDYAFPEDVNNYKNILGKIDVEGLTEEVLFSGRNKYGYIINETALAGNILYGSITLNGEIYYSDNNLTIASPVLIYNGATGVDGSGLIVVEGDLYIDHDIIYEQSYLLSEIYNLASVGWLVKGDIYISPTVREIDGAFFALGSNGVINTGSGTYPLEVSGLMFAKQFNFERTYTAVEAGSTAEPAEKIIYDGRLMVNTPPGLGDFSQVLPSFKETTP